MQTQRYRGRFAPSPTGALHQGSLVAALASFLDARARGGEWLVRIEDVDISRNVPGAGDEILHCLEACALPWDGEVVWQTTRFCAYQEALDQLTGGRHAYPCGCSRKELGESGGYPGTCRMGLFPGREARSIRLRVPDAAMAAIPQGDFPLYRADGIWAYQLAVVVDDAWQQITHVVRGADLLDSTPRHRVLQGLLGYPSPEYTHIPVVLAADGQKLSKQTKAPAVTKPREALLTALRFLKQSTPPALDQGTPEEIVAHAIKHWSLDAALH